MGYSFLPDLPTETPDTWRVCDGFHSDIYGNYRTGWLPAVDAILPGAVGGSSKFQWGMAYVTAAGARQALLLHNTTTADATARSYVYNGSTWNNREGAGSGSGLCALQVGNITLVGGVQAAMGIVQRDATGVANFAQVASSPTSIGGLAVNALNIVLAIDTASDAWYTSDSNAPTLWTGGEAASGNFRLTNGNLTACVALGNDFIVFKDKGVYRGTYVGGAVKWVWTLIDSERGAWARGCAVVADGKIIFIGRLGVFSYDGASFERLDYGIWRALVTAFGYQNSSFSDADYDATKLIWDAQNKTVFFFQLGNPVLADCREKSANIFYSYNVVSKKWGYQSVLSETGSSTYWAVLDIAAYNFYNSGSLRFNTDVGFYSSADDKIVALTTSFTPALLPGTNYKPNLRTSRLGVRDRMTYVERFIPHWTLADGVGTDLSTATVKTATHYYSDSVFESNTTGDTATLTTDQYWADLRKDARWHNVELKLNCEAVIDGGTWVAKQTGKN